MKIKVFVGMALGLYTVILISIFSSAFIIHQQNKNRKIFGQVAEKSGAGGGLGTGTDALIDASFLTIDEVAKHTTTADCWITINNKVYDVDDFLGSHPGGGSLITPYCGKDATIAFASKDKNPNKDHSQTAYDMLANYFVGNLGSELPSNLADASNNTTNRSGTANSSTNSTTNQSGTTSRQITTKTPGAAISQLPASNPAASASLSLTPEEVAKHNTLANCWLIISGNIYEVTSYISSHPGGANSIAPYCGKNGTSGFATKDTGSSHSSFAYGQLGNYLIGSLGSAVALNPGSPATPPKQPPIANLPGGMVPPVTSSPNPNKPAPSPTPAPAPAPTTPAPAPTLTLSSVEVASHNNAANCWMIVLGKVYAVTSYIAAHPGGAQTILDYCGKDGTSAFQTKGVKGKDHKPEAYNILNSYLIGTLGSAVPVTPPSGSQPTPTPMPTPMPTPTPTAGTPPPSTPLPSPKPGCAPYGELPSSVAAKYSGATIIKQSIGGDCKQVLKINYNGECRQIHTDPAGNITKDEIC